MMTPPVGRTMSAMPSVKEPLWKHKPCGDAVPAAPNGLIEAPAAGAATTFWKGPDSTMAGKIGTVAAPAEDETLAVVVKTCNEPVEVFSCGLTEKTPVVPEPIVKQLPLLNRLVTVPALLKTREDPDCPPALIVIVVAPFSAPTVLMPTFWSMAHAAPMA